MFYLFLPGIRSHYFGVVAHSSHVGVVLGGKQKTNQQTQGFIFIFLLCLLFTMKIEFKRKQNQLFEYQAECIRSTRCVCDSFHWFHFFFNCIFTGIAYTQLFVRCVRLFWQIDWNACEDLWTSNWGHIWIHLLLQDANPKIRLPIKRSTSNDKKIFSKISGFFIRRA